MEFRKYLQILVSRGLLIGLTAIAALVVALLVSYRMKPVYSASATVRVAGAGSGLANAQDVNYADRVMQTYVHLLQTRPYLENAVKDLKLPVTPDQLAGQVKVEAIPTTELIRITVSDPNPQTAAGIANDLANSLAAQGEQLYSGDGKSPVAILQGQLTNADQQLRRDRAVLASLDSAAPNLQASLAATKSDLSARIEAEQRTYNVILDQYNQALLTDAMRANSISVAETAGVPQRPSKPNIPLNAGLATLLGLVGGLGLVLLLENVSPTVRSAQDIETATALMVVGRVPVYQLRGRSRERLVLLRRGASLTAGAEAFRRVSSNLLSLAHRKRIRHLMITSVEAGAGKSTVLANVAVAMAQAGRQVLLVDADLRNPALHALFGLLPAPGLGEVIANPELLVGSIRQTKVSGLRLLPAGLTVPNPGQLLSSPALVQLLARLSEDVDLVLWDTAPMGPVADASLLAPLMDGVVLVAVPNHTPMGGLERAIDDLEQVGVTPLGVILNRSAEKAGAYYHRYGSSTLRTNGNGHLEPRPETGAVTPAIEPSFSSGALPGTHGQPE